MEGDKVTTKNKKTIATDFDLSDFRGNSEVASFLEKEKEGEA